jgi:archaellum biogenesis protein FlaJ (TadC family)
MALFAALAGSLVVGGIVMLVLFFSPAPPRPVNKKSSVGLGQRWRRVSKATRVRILIGVVLGVVVAVFTSIPLLIVVIPAAIVGIPLLLGKQDTREQQLILALETWSRSLASTAETGKFTLREVVGITRGAVPEILRVPVDRLYSRMSASWSAADAFRAFADEFDNAYVDEVTIYLIQAAEFDSGGLARALSGVADTLAAQAKLRMEVYNEREKPRGTMRIMTVILAVVLIGIVLFSHSTQMSFYTTPAGQIALAIILGMFGALLIWAKSQTRHTPEPRIILASTEEARS